MRRSVSLCAAAGALMAMAGLCSASAARSVKPNRTDFTEPTHIGKVHVTLEIHRSGGRRQLTGLKISVNGQALAWPANLELRIPDPGISQVELVSTATYTCIDDGAEGMVCPDLSQTPAFLIIPFGENANRAEVRDGRCHRSFLFISILTDRIDEISRSDCPAGGAEEVDEHVLFGSD